MALPYEASQSLTGHTALTRLLGTSDRPTQTPLPDNTQHSQGTDIHAPNGIRTHTPSQPASQPAAADRTADGIGSTVHSSINNVMWFAVVTIKLQSFPCRLTTRKEYKRLSDFKCITSLIHQYMPITTINYRGV